MSRIGKMPINVPDGVEITLNDGNITVKGKLGQLVKSLRPEVVIKQETKQIIVERKSEDKIAKSMHGLYRQLINNMVVGVSQGFKKVLQIQGVGYRAELKENALVMSLGYSNPIYYEVEEGIKVAVEGQTKVTVSGIDKQRVGQVSSELRSLRPPEPYKGKGIRYENEVVRRKVGKSGAK